MASYTEAKSFVLDAMIAGGTAAAVKTIMAPIQNHRLILYLNPPSKSITEGVKRVGLKFWTNNVRNSALYGLSTALQFGAFHFWTRNSKLLFRKEQFGQQIIGNVLAGGLAGFLVLPVTYPLSRLHIPFKPAAILSAPGWAKFIHYYDGVQYSSVPVLVHKGLYFGLYESLKPILIQDPENSPIKSLMLATATSYTALYASHPFDVIRRESMIIDMSIRPRGWRVARDLIRQRGFGALYRGYINTLPALTGAIVLVGFDQLRSVIKKHQIVSEN